MELKSHSVPVWGWRRWLLVSAVVLTVQLVLIFRLTDKRSLTAPQAPPRFRVQMASSHATAQSKPLPTEFLNPTLFALVNANGFSGSAWLKVKRFDYRMTNQPEPLHLLSRTPEELGQDFEEFVQTNVLEEDVVLDIVAPSVTQLPLKTPRVVPAALWTAEGALAERALLSPLLLAAPSAPIMTRTVIHLLVNREGTTLSAALVSSCGVAKADQDALRFATSARFAAAPPYPKEGAEGDEHVTGYLVFQWSRCDWDEKLPESRAK